MCKPEISCFCCKLSWFQYFSPPGTGSVQATKKDFFQLLQLRVLCVGFLQDGDVGVFQEGEEILIRRLCLDAVTGDGRTRGASARSRAPARCSLLERVPKRGALVFSGKVELDHRLRWYERLELVG